MSERTDVSINTTVPTDGRSGRGRSMSIGKIPATEPEYGMLRALCCECGTVRKVSSRYNGKVTDRSFEGWPTDEDPMPERCTQVLKCMTCGRQTKHAILRDFDHYATSAEKRRTDDKTRAAIRKVLILRERFAELGITIYEVDRITGYDGPSPTVELIRAGTGYGPGRWSVNVVEDATITEQAAGLATALQWLGSTGEDQGIRLPDGSSAWACGRRKARQ